MHNLLIAMLIAALLTLGWSLSRLFVYETVFDHEIGFLYRRGRRVRSLTAGRYRLRRHHEIVRKLNLRRQVQTIHGQDVLTADQVQVRISLVADYRVAEPERVLELENDAQQLHLSLQLLLREAVRPLSLDRLLEDTPAVQAELQQRAGVALAELGFGLQSLAIKDLMLPGDLKRLYAQALTARKEAAAALERARGEQATLRSLANAARLLEKNPALLNLRLIQALESAPGKHSIVFQAGPSKACEAAETLVDHLPD